MSKLNNVYKSRFGEQLNKEKALVTTPEGKKPMEHTQPITPQLPKVTLDSTKVTAKPTQAKKAKTEPKIEKIEETQSDSTTQTVDSSSNTRTLREGMYTKSKTFFLPVEFHEMFEFIKWKRKMDHSKFAIKAIEQAFKAEFGENWRDMLKE